MRDVVTFRDATAAILTFLRDQLDVPTAGAVPTDRKIGDGPLLVGRRVGGVSDLVVDHATEIVEAWHDTDAEAHDLAQDARALLLALWGDVIGGVLVYRVAELAGPAADQDPYQRSPRYTATYVVDTRGT